MEEWKEYKLGEVCSRLRSGKGIKADSVFEIGKFPVIGGNGVRGYTNISNFSGQAAIIGRQGAYCGNVRYFEGEAYMTEHAVVVVGNELADTRFLSCALSLMHLGNLSAQSAQPGISVQTLSKQIIRLPSFSYQKRVSSLIKSLDDKIEVNRRINENLEQQAQALFKSWLSKCKDEVTIGDLSLNITDYTKCNQEKVVLINSSDVTEGHFEHHILSENKDLKGHFKKRFQKGDILYSQVRPRNRHWGYCTFDADNYIASTQLMVIRNKPELISSILLYQYIIDERVWLDFTLKTETRSGTFPQGNYEELSSIKVPFGAETAQISSVLESLYFKIFSNEKESRLLAELRDTLLPKLMSGELRVQNTDLINEMLAKGIR
jgi:type I restriction enzyme S subunit